MPKRKYKSGVCPECKIRKGDSTRKTLYRCRYCERWFCADHFDPRLAVIRDLKRRIKDLKLRSIMEEEWKREDGHPDYDYTLKRLKELDVEKEMDRRMITASLDRSKMYKKRTHKKQKVCPKCGSISIGVLSFDREKENLRCQTCGYEWKHRKLIEPDNEENGTEWIKRHINHTKVSKPKKQKRSKKVGNAILVLGIIILILGIGLMVFPESSHEEGEFLFQSLGRPVSAFNLGIIPKNVEIRVDYNVKEDSYGLSEGSLYVILINTSELFVIDRAWNSRPAKDLLYPHYAEFKFNNVDFNYRAYDGPSAEGSLSWVTTYETNYTVLVWLDEVGTITLNLVYFIRIDATWYPYFAYGTILAIIGIITACIGFAYRRYSSR